MFSFLLGEVRFPHETPLVEGWEWACKGSTALGAR